jgi:hypothetical protein
MGENWQADLERWLGAVAWPVFGGAGEQDRTSDVSGLYRRPDWAG